MVGAKRVDWYALCPGRVRYVGEAVAAVVAVDRASATLAAARVDVDYEVLPPVTTAAAALVDGSTLVEPSWGDNVRFSQRFVEGQVPDEGPGVRVLTGSVSSQRISGAPLEPRGIVATYEDADDMLRIWESTQQPHLVRSYVAQALGRPERNVVVVQPHVGGAFGLKQPTSQEEVLLGCLAVKLGRPVRWVEERSESLAVGGHARETTCAYRVAFGDDGRLLGLEVDVVADVGAPTAFLGWGMSVVTMFTLPTVYKVPAVDVTLRSVVTTKCPWTPCRGFGKDVATLLMERVLDRVARKVGLDRVEVRLRNLIQADEFPYHLVSGGVLDSGDYPKALRSVAEAIGYDGFGAERVTARAEGRRLGLGLAMELTPEGVAVAGSLMNNGYDGATVRVTPTGEVTVPSGVTTPGTGNETVLAQIAADALGCDINAGTTHIDQTLTGVDLFGTVALVFVSVGSYTYSWVTYAADYSRYLSRDSSRKKVFLYPFLGCSLSAIWMELLGLAVATRILAGGISGASKTIRDLMGGGFLGGVALVAIFLSIVGTNTLDDYTGSISLQTAGLRILRPATAVISAVLSFLVSLWFIYGGEELASKVQNFLLFISYWITAWLGVVAVDWVRRRGSVDVGVLDRLRNIHSGWQALVSMLVGFLCALPFSNTTIGYNYVTGHPDSPLRWLIGEFSINNLHGVDLGFLVGFVVAAVLYMILDRRTGSQVRYLAPKSSSPQEAVPVD